MEQKTFVIGFTTITLTENQYLKVKDNFCVLEEGLLSEILANDPFFIQRIFVVAYKSGVTKCKISRQTEWDSFREKFFSF